MFTMAHSVLLIVLHFLCCESLIQPSSHAHAIGRSILQPVDAHTKGRSTVYPLGGLSTSHGRSYLQPLEHGSSHGHSHGHSHDHESIIPNPVSMLKDMWASWMNMKKGIERHSSPVPLADYILKNQNLADRVTFLGIIVSACWDIYLPTLRSLLCCCVQ
jgi:hypothetical protein